MERLLVPAAALVAQLAGEGRYAGSGEDRQEMDFDKRLHLVSRASCRVGAWQLSKGSEKPQQYPGDCRRKEEPVSTGDPSQVAFFWNLEFQCDFKSYSFNQTGNKQRKTRPNQRTKNTPWILLIQMAERVPQVRNPA